MGKIRITFITGTLGAGGAERQLFYIIKTLNNMGTNLSVITLDENQYYESCIRNLGIPVFSVGRFQNKIIRLIKILSIINRIKPNIIQSQHFYTNLYASIAGRLIGVPDIGAIRSNGIHEVKSLGKLFGWLSLHLPKYIAANSKAGITYSLDSKVPIHKLRLLTNVVDTSFFIPTEKIRADKKIIILMVSNLQFREKRVDYFIHAINQLPESLKKIISALIVGDGSLREEYILLAKNYGLFPTQINFLGRIDNVNEVYKNADILVHPSDREGTPNVIIEGMSCGIPVIATSVGGIPDIVQDGSTGFLIPLGDIDYLVNKLAFLCQSPSLRHQMGKLGREYILANHSLESFPNKLDDFYSSILAK